jgi:hypothetical protein
MSLIASIIGWVVIVAIVLITILLVLVYLSENVKFRFDRKEHIYGITLWKYVFALTPATKLYDWIVDVQEAHEKGYSGHKVTSVFYKKLRTGPPEWGYAFVVVPPVGWPVDRSKALVRPDDEDDWDD